MQSTMMSVDASACSLRLDLDVQRRGPEGTGRLKLSPAYCTGDTSLSRQRWRYQVMLQAPQPTNNRRDSLRSPPMSGGVGPTAGGIALPSMGQPPPPQHPEPTSPTARPHHHYYLFSGHLGK